MGKKKVKAPQKEKWVAEPSNQSMKDDEASVAKVTKPCPHIDNGVDLNLLHTKLTVASASAVICCQDCRKMKEKGKHSKMKGKGKHSKMKGCRDSNSEPKSVWLCLECGHYACGGVGLHLKPQSHAVWHARKNFHPLVMQFGNPQMLWCFQCKTLVTTDKTGKSGEEEGAFSEVMKPIQGDSSSVQNKQDGSALLLGARRSGLELLLLPEVATTGNSLGVSTLVSGDTLSYEASLCSLALNSEKSDNVSMVDMEMRLTNFFASFDAEDRLSVTIDDIAPLLSGDQSSFEGVKVLSEFVIPLAKFAEKYGGGSFSGLLAEGKSARQKHILIEELGCVLYSMEVEEVKTEETFLIWRDACRDIIDWGLHVEFILHRLKQAARNFFGYMLKPPGSENYCREIKRLEKAVFELRNELSNLEQQLGNAQENLSTRLGDATGSDTMVCVLESSWTPQSRAVHSLY